MRKSTTTMAIVSMMLLSSCIIFPTLCAIGTPDIQTFEFVEGWNLFTIPLNVENNTVEALFGNNSYLPYCFGWNSTNQNYEIVYTLIPGYGYWIYVNESTTCSINGSSITEGLSIDLAAHKNLIGWIHNYTTTAEQICKTIPGCSDVGILSDENQIIDPNNVSYITHYNGSSENNFDITQGMGFWINVSTPSVWNGSAPPKPLSAKIIVPAKANIGDSVQMYVSVDGGIQPYGWLWDFGDGITSDVQNPTHRYIEYGNHTVSLTVKDSKNNTVTSSATITIEDKVNPTVKIEKPMRALYIKNKFIRKLFFRMALIIGGITIEVNATDVNGSGIAKVEFYAGLFKLNYLGNDTSEPYSFNWAKDRLFRVFHIQFIKVIAYDNAGHTAVAKMIVRKFL